MRSNALAASPSPQGNLPCCPSHVQPAAHATPIDHPHLRPWPQRVSAGDGLFHLSASGITTAIRQVIQCHVISVHIRSICVLVLLPGQPNCGKVYTSAALVLSGPAPHADIISGRRRTCRDTTAEQKAAQWASAYGSACVYEPAKPPSQWHQAAPRQLLGQLHNHQLVTHRTWGLLSTGSVSSATA